MKELPEGWEWKTIGELSQKVTDGTHKTPKYTESGIPFISTANLNLMMMDDFDYSNYQKFISPEEHKELIKRCKPEKGDILISKCGTIGRTKQVNVDYEFSIFVGLALVKLKKDIVSGAYLEKILNHDYFKKQMQRASPGSSRNTLTINALTKVKIPLPPLETQKQIVAILDKAEQTKRLQVQANDLIDDFLKSVFIEMFGDPIKNPMGWPSIKLEECAQVERGKFTPRPRNDPRYYGGNYPFIQTGDISEANGYLYCHHQTLNEEGIKVSKAFDAGTVVIAIVGATIGQTGILTYEVYAPDSVVGITPIKGKTTPEYIEYVLRFWRQIFLARAPATARANINLQIIKPIKIPNPPFEKQEKFTNIVMTIEKTRKLITSFSNQHEKLSSSLVQRAFTGELIA